MYCIGFWRLEGWRPPRATGNLGTSLSSPIRRLSVSCLGEVERFIKDSVLTIVGCGSVDTPYARRWSTIDVTIALQNMIIAAQAQGVGSCWIGDFKQREVKKILGIPKNLKVIALIALGYPAEHPEPKGKKDLEEIVHHNRF